MSVFDYWVRLNTSFRLCCGGTVRVVGQFPGVCCNQMHNDKIMRSQADRDQPPECGTIAVLKVGCWRSIESGASTLAGRRAGGKKKRSKSPPHMAFAILSCTRESSTVGWMCRRHWNPAAPAPNPSSELIHVSAVLDTEPAKEQRQTFCQTYTTAQTHVARVLSTLKCKRIPLPLPAEVVDCNGFYLLYVMSLYLCQSTT